jgi:hypothetical protein
MMQERASKACAFCIPPPRPSDPSPPRRAALRSAPGWYPICKGKVARPEQVSPYSGRLTHPLANTMSHPFYDRRAASLLSKVSDDLADLREDLGKLLSHTTRRTLPRGARDLAESARDLADTARHGLAAGGAYASSHLRSLGGYQPSRCTTGWVGGALLLGILAAGVYAFCQSGESDYYGSNDDDVPV